MIKIMNYGSVPNFDSGWALFCWLIIFPTALFASIYDDAEGNVPKGLSPKRICCVI